MSNLLGFPAILAALLMILSGCTQSGTVEPVPPDVTDTEQQQKEYTMADYEEYFSKEVPFEEEIEDDGYSYRIAKSYHNYLYKISKETDIGLPIIREDVTDYRVISDGIIAIIDRKEIIKTDKEGGNRKSLYQSDGLVKCLSTNNTLTFFRVGDTIYRIYLPLGLVEEIYTDTDTSDCRPVSNYALWFYKETEYIKYYNEAVEKYRLYDYESWPDELAHKVDMEYRQYFYEENGSDKLHDCYMYNWKTKELTQLEETGNVTETTYEIEGYDGVWMAY